LKRILPLTMLVLVNGLFVFSFGQTAPATKDSLHTIAGDLEILEVQERCKYNLVLNGKIILRTDCADESNKYYSTPEPTIHTYYKSIEGIDDFAEIILFQMQMLGNACDGGDLIFLGLKTDKSYLLSNNIPFCGGRQPVITWGPNKVTLFIPGGPPNRGKGYIPSETWVYEKGFVTKLAAKGGRK
jgi:hypothetical protein